MAKATNMATEIVASTLDQLWKVAFFLNTENDQIFKILPYSLQKLILLFLVLVSPSIIIFFLF